MLKRSLQKTLLLNLRSKLVGSNHTLPFTVYTDQNIEDLLDAQPTTMEELYAVKGFPKEGKRVKSYGESILQIFKEPEKIKSISVDVSTDGVQVKTEIKNMKLF